MLTPGRLIALAVAAVLAVLAFVVVLGALAPSTTPDTCDEAVAELVAMAEGRQPYDADRVRYLNRWADRNGCDR